MTNIKPAPAKVTHVVFISEMPGIYPFSGLENHLLVLLPALSGRGIDTELIVVTRNVGPEMQARFKKLEAAGIRITLCPCSRARPWHLLGIRRLEQAVRLQTLLKERRGRIIHFHIDPLIVGLALYTAKPEAAVLSVHNDEPWLYRPHVRWWLQWLDRRISHYIAISEQVRRHYIGAARIPADKIETIYYGIEPPVSVSAAQEIRSRHNIPQDQFVVGFVGRLTPQKNVPLLLAAMRELPDLHLVLIGDGELRMELENMVAAWGLKNVQFLGRLPDAADLMPAFDVFCLPSRFEGLGLVLIEAMLRKVPIIGSRAGAIPEILDGGKYGILFNADDASGLVQAIQYARTQSESVAQMSLDAWTHAQDFFTVERMTQQTIELYRQIGSTTHANPPTL